MKVYQYAKRTSLTDDNVIDMDAVVWIAVPDSVELVLADPDDKMLSLTLTDYAEPVPGTDLILLGTMPPAAADETVTLRTVIEAGIDAAQDCVDNTGDKGAMNRLEDWAVQASDHLPDLGCECTGDLPVRVTCGACNRSWCERCDPAPGALCHWCHGRGSSQAQLA